MSSTISQNVSAMPKAKDLSLADLKKIGRGDSIWRKAGRKLAKQPHVLVCFGIIALYIILALFNYAGLLPDYQQRIGGSYEPPELSIAKILGTDVFGRSVFYKILAGASTAMTIGFTVAGIALPIGLTLGCFAAYFGGKVDELVVWFYSVIMSVPGLLLIIAISWVLGKGMIAVCIALAFVSWVGLCRLVRGEVMKHRESEYVLATQLLGGSDFRIIFRHILPNVFHLAIVTGSLLVLGAIKSEVILTYIGVGIQSGASWGRMISDAPGELVNGVWWPLTGVVVFMFAIIYALNVVGDALRDALDPKLIN